MLHGFIRDFFLLLDKAVYTILSVIFQLIVDLANFRLFSNEAITSFSNRIYLILGIVMVFKLMISFIQMLINPDNMQDKEKGLGGILKRVVISLILIVMIRPIFDLSRQLQEKLLPIIPKVILAAKIDAFDDGEVTTSAGRLLSYYSFIPFFYPYPGCEGESHLSGLGTDENATIYSVNDITSKEAKLTCTYSTDDDGYLYRYQFGISTLVGAFLIYVLVTVALKIAIRAIKLSLCEILAPIPIASYIDPKTSKQSFDKWVETSIKTYLDLFTRLAVVYFVIYVFTLLFTSQNGGLTRFQQLVGQYNGDTGRALLVTLFIIVGLLYFAKEMPKFITGLLGIPEGFSDIGDMFKGQGWRALGGAAGMVKNTASAGLSAYNYSRFKHEGKGTALRRALGATLTTAGRSARAVSDGKGYTGTLDAKKTTMSNVMRNVNTARNKSKAKENYQAQLEDYETKQSAYNEAVAKYNQKMSRLSTNLNVANNKMQRAKERSSNSWQEYLKAKKSGDTKKASMHLLNYQQAKNTQELIQKEINSLQSEMNNMSAPTAPTRPTRPSSYGIGRMEAAWNNFTGTPVPTSKSYSEASSLMNSGKKIFNDAKVKVAEDPTLIKDVFTLKDKNGNTYGNGTFADVFSAKKTAEATGKATINGVEYTAAQIESIYGEALKTASTYYVDGVKNGNIANNTMLGDIAIFEDSMENDMIVDSADSARVTSSYDKKNPGKFYRSADEIGKDFEEKARELKRTEVDSSN